MALNFPEIVGPESKRITQKSRQISQPELPATGQTAFTNKLWGGQGQRFRRFLVHPRGHKNFRTQLLWKKYKQPRVAPVRFGCGPRTVGSDGSSGERAFLQCHAEGGATKGGVSKCEQTQANADKRGQTQANAEAKTQANASKREQTWTNANKRLHPPLLRFFTPPFAIPLFLHLNWAQFNRRERFWFRCRFLQSGSEGSGSSVSSWTRRSDDSGFRRRFGSWATLTAASPSQAPSKRCWRACCCPNFCQCGFCMFREFAQIWCKFRCNFPVFSTGHLRGFRTNLGAIFFQNFTWVESVRQSKPKKVKFANLQERSPERHRILQGAPPTGRQLYFTFPSAPDPLFKASNAAFLTLRVATP